MDAFFQYSRLQWTLNRLRSMDSAELGFRLRRKVQDAAELAGIGLARPGAPNGQSGAAWVPALSRSFDAQRYTRAADRILDGIYDVFALESLQLGFPPRWNTDPQTGREAPLVFGKSLDYRDPARVGNIKYLWEINRHLELVTLAQAWHLSGEERYAQGCRKLLDSWFAECPYPKGVNWCVSLEHAVRLANWSFAWHLLGGERSPLFAGPDGRMFRHRWLSAIYQHCHFIARYRSRHSSANNHLIGEATGLFIGAVTWPMWRESARWIHEARAELMREALAQVCADGVNREQAFWYHHAVADMMLVAGLVGRANRFDLGFPFWQRLEAMLELLASVMDVGGNVPQVGDADDGVLLRLNPDRQASVFRSLLATGSVLFSRPEFCAKAGGFDDKSRWLLGDRGAARFATLAGMPAALPVRRAFPEGGYYILGSDFETEREVRVVADAGPLGYLSIAAHGHADALSFTLSVGGRPILVDPGTFAYHTERKWRDYFRGTTAHNTLTVDGTDQSVIGGNFLWLEHAETLVEDFAVNGPTQTLSARHEGYRRLPQPVTHLRTLEYDPQRALLAVTDQLSGEGSHRIDVHWHFAPECSVRLEGHDVIAERDGIGLRIACPAEMRIELVRAREEPPLGWYSSGFDRRQPTTTAVCSFSGRVRNCWLAFQIQVKRP